MQVSVILATHTDQACISDSDCVFIYKLPMVVTLTCILQSLWIRVFQAKSSRHSFFMQMWSTDFLGEHQLLVDLANSCLVDATHCSVLPCIPDMSGTQPLTPASYWTDEWIFLTLSSASWTYMSHLSFFLSGSWIYHHIPASDHPAWAWLGRLDTQKLGAACANLLLSYRRE